MPIAKPTVSWLTFAPGDTDRARHLIATLKGEGLLDELGFTPLQARFADRFYPATTTIMTRPRYLYLVPPLYRYMERTRDVGARDIENQMRAKQDELRVALSKHEHRHVIGAQRGKDVKRLPADVYWLALQKLGIFQWTTSGRSYHSSLGSAPRARRAVDDDKRALTGDERNEPAWDIGLPSLDMFGSGKFPEPTTFDLTRAEADDLVARYRDLDERVGLGPSLLSHVVAARRRASPVGDVAMPWEFSDLPDGLQRAVDHARALSAFACGAVLLYHQMLVDESELKGLPVPDADYRDDFATWFSAGREILANWDLGDLAALELPDADANLEGIMSSVPFREGGRLAADLSFIRRLVGRVVRVKGADAVFDDPEARRLIRDREYAKRRGRARLFNKTYLGRWKPRERYEELYELGFRHGVGVRFAEDIIAGLRRSA